MPPHPTTAHVSRILSLVFCGVVGLLAGARSTLQETSTYSTLVSAYRNQDAASIRQLAARPVSDVRALVDEALYDSRGQTAWTPDDLRAAAMVHTEVCLQLLESGRTSAAFVHLSAAGALIDMSDRELRPSGAFAQAWYVNVSMLLREAGAPVWADELQKRAHDRSMKSPGEAKFQNGLEFEARACERGSLSAFDMKLSDDLRSAAREYEAALRKDPGLHRAALHLGRVRILRGTAATALAPLERATASSMRSERYLALLFLGAIAEGDDKPDEAEARYRLALRTFPWGQSGKMALARVLTRLGREGEGRATVADSLAVDRRQVADPLWTYLARAGEQTAATFDLMRAEVWR